MKKKDWVDVIGLLFGLVILGDICYMLLMDGSYRHPYISFIVMSVFLIGLAITDKINHND
jgi:hypothetical protein